MGLHLSASQHGLSSPSLHVCRSPSFLSVFMNYFELRAFGVEKNKTQNHRRSFQFVLFQASLISFTYAHCLSLASLLVAWHRFSCILPPFTGFSPPFHMGAHCFQGSSLALVMYSALSGLKRAACDFHLLFFSFSNYLFHFSSIPRLHFPLPPYWNVDTALLTRLLLNIQHCPKCPHRRFIHNDSVFVVETDLTALDNV